MKRALFLSDDDGLLLNALSSVALIFWCSRAAGTASSVCSDDQRRLSCVFEVVTVNNLLS